ncbi:MULTISPECIES: phosphotransferase family protein [unclassified Mycobacterium]|uniref:phosphotransferase family protein n=1 Tax=unclassified Mycobacterium TaxID=2642494 RepID=UPI0029C68740|nr:MULTISPECIES: phosphotransferase family protein [unclassified Mycobacterium]
MTAALTVEDAVDLTRLSAWIRASGLGDGVIDAPVVLTGGTQNILLRFRTGGRDVVLRRPPAHPRPNNNQLLLREARVLQALGSTAIPHARLLGICDDPSVIGSTVFFLMEAVEGFNPAVELPEHLSDQSGRDRLALAATDALAQLGSVDHEAIGLADLGRPAGFLQRQVTRWVAEREKYLALDGYDGVALPGFEAVRDYLADAVLPTFRPGLIHGDYHFGNLIFDASSAKLAAVLDWEMSTIGDPLLDLGRFLAMWPDEHEVIMTSGGIWTAGPLPPPDTIAARYAERSGRSLEHLAWYVVMGCFKLGIILEGTYARACAGQAPLEVGLALHDTAVRLFERATRLVGRT